MKITVKEEDIQSGNEPISNAIRREYEKDAFIDKKFIVFKGQEAFPKRMPKVAENFTYKFYVGEEVKPFEFSI